LSETKYIEAIKNNFPNTNKDEVSSAEIGRELRSMLSDNLKIQKFPNKKELQLILANSTQEAISQIQFKLFKSHNQLKYKTKEHEDIVGFYYVRGNIDPTYSTRFLGLEKTMKNWMKENEIQIHNPIKLNVYSPIQRYFEHQMINFKSYSELAEKFEMRLKFLDQTIIPKHENLKDIIELNKFLNYSDDESDSFNGMGRRFKTDINPILPNAIVSIVAKDPNCDEIIEREVMQYLKTQEERLKYKSAFVNLKKEYDA
jgi:hypothetical protein